MSEYFGNLIFLGVYNRPDGGKPVNYVPISISDICDVNWNLSDGIASGWYRLGCRNLKYQVGSYLLRITNTCTRRIVKPIWPQKLDEKRMKK